MPTGVFFPDIVPSSRRYRPGRIPSSKFKALNGATTEIRYGNRLVDASIEAEFKNISDDRAADVVQLYRDTTKSGDWLIFTRSDLTGGVSEKLRSWLRDTDGSGLRWRFDAEQEPSVESVRPGRSTLSCRFIGELDAP
jgi:hypothetical protein